MDRDGLIRELHELAAQMTKAERLHAAPVDASGDASLVDQYGFSSLDALEYLLILEEKFDVVFEDEELTEETLFSIQGLATYILDQKAGQSPSIP
ncbi:phosphopantetheine-binding protein [Streptomyces sp. NPDC048057]|uniref:acyl carrier protein n=1 Tax=Streptomyces sp. NPDC048057 TaxID=3155628 RepID=UPI0033D33F08